MFKQLDIWEFLIGVAIFGAMILAEEPKNEPSNGKTRSENESDYGWDDEKWTVPPQSQYPHWYADNGAYQADERRYWRHQIRALWTNVGVGGATFIAAVVAGFIAYWAYQATTSAVIEAQKQTIEAQKQTAQAQRQAAAAESQIAIAKDTEERQLRAYVMVESSIIEIDANKIPKVHLVIKNFGLTPTYNFRHWACAVVRDFPDREQDFLPVQCSLHSMLHSPS